MEVYGRKMITELEILKSKAIQTEKEAEQAKQKYIDACRRKGIPEEKIEETVKKIEEMSSNIGNIISDVVMRKIEKKIEKGGID